MPPASSVFVGGGTPSQIPGPLLGSLIAAIPRQSGAEVTVECNPDDAATETFRHWRARRRHPGQPRCPVDAASRAAVRSAALTTRRPSLGPSIS